MFSEDTDNVRFSSGLVWNGAGVRFDFRKANPYHDNRGRFSDAPGGAGSGEVSTATAETDAEGWSTQQLYHGSGAVLTDAAFKQPLYLTDVPGEAAGFAEGRHLGGSTGLPKVYGIKFKPGYTVDINNLIDAAIENDDDIGAAIDAGIKENYRDTGGARYLTFMHPGFSGDDFKAVIALHPNQDLKIVSSMPAQLYDKYNPFHDDLGRFTTGDGTISSGFEFEGGGSTHIGAADQDAVATIQDWKAQGGGQSHNSMGDLPETRFGTGNIGIETLGVDAGLPPNLSEHRGGASEFTDTGDVSPPSSHQMQQDEKQTIYSYTGSGNVPINKFLRDNIIPDFDISTVNDRIKQLDRVFLDTSSAKAMTLYRGISQSAQDKLDEAIAHNDGHFVDKGFVSTSSDEGTAKNWKSGVYVTIELPKGSKALDLENPKELTSNPGEGEWLLARDQHFIVSKDTDSHGYRSWNAHYFARLVNTGPAKPKDSHQMDMAFVQVGPVNKVDDEHYDASEKFTWEASHIVPGNPDVEKYNENHDEAGRFATDDGLAGPAPLKEGDIVAYHGTFPSAVKSILKDGIKAQPFKNFDQLYYQGDRGQSIFVTRSKETAENWADAGSGVILEVHVPKEEWPKFQRDTFATEAFYAPITIPPAWITSVSGRATDDTVWTKPASMFKAKDYVTIYVVVFLDQAPTADELADFEKYNPFHDQVGRFASGSSSGSLTPSEQAIVRANRQQAQAHFIRDVLENQLDFDPDMVSIRYANKTFELNDKNYDYAGAAYPDGHIEVWPEKSRSTNDLAEVLAHEVMHEHFNNFIAEYEKQSVEAEKAYDLHGTKVFSLDGQLTPEYAAKWPLYDEVARNGLFSGVKMAVSDGITDYSREWWNAWHAGTADTKQAIHETLAEIASNNMRVVNSVRNAGGRDKWTPFNPDHPYSPNDPDWKHLYNLVNETWVRTHDDSPTG